MNNTISKTPNSDLLPLYLEDINEFPQFYYQIQNNDKTIDLTIYTDTDDKNAEVAFKFLKDKSGSCFTLYGLHLVEEFPLLNENLFLSLIVDFLATAN
jgi:hypothetical protein